jgi:predicted TIM-barrel fold metal-dependent hydrolase
MSQLDLSDDTEEFLIVDSDSHITEPADMWTSRVPTKFVERVPRVDTHPQSGSSNWRIGNHWLGPVGSLAQAGFNQYMPVTPLEYSDCDPGSFDARTRLERLDEYGIRIQVVYPNIVGFHAKLIAELGAELALLCVRAYNDFMLEWTAVAPERLIPIAMLPFWDREESVSEMNRCVELGYRGVLFANKLERINMPSYVDPHWDPIYAAAQDLDIPINFHIGFADPGKMHEADSMIEARNNADSFRIPKALATTALFMQQSSVLGPLLTSGICDRFPRLKLVNTESGFGHIPFYLETLDWQVHTYGAHKGLNFLPSEYFKRQCYGTFWFERASLPLLSVYPDNFMFSTDYPHPTSLSPGPCSPTQQLPMDYARESFAGIDRSLAQKALFENAVSLYKLEI